MYIVTSGGKLMSVGYCDVLLAAKLCEFNSQCDASCQVTDADITSLEQLVSGQQASTPAQLDTLWRMMQWPAGLH